MLLKPPQSSIYTVSQLTAHIKHLLESDPLLRFVSVQGEISNLRRPLSGHVYFTLKDQGACLRCVMFRRQAAAVPFQLQEGAGVVVRGEISLYDRDGVYQLYAHTVEPLGVGSLYIAFQQLKAKLEGEGLFAENRKRPLPAYPGKIAVVTSSTGAALHDIITTLKKRFPVEVIVVPAVVQGEAAPDSIASAVSKAADLPGVDLVILARGGGSLEELWAFNDEKVARAVASCPVPVVSGVGHETDFTIADFVSDCRAPTPTGAAQRAVPEVIQLSAGLQAAESRLIREMQHRLQLRKTGLTDRENRLQRVSPRRRLMQTSQLLDNLEERIRRQGVLYLRRKGEKLEHLRERLEAVSPLKIMGRGYAYCTDGKDRLVRSAAVLNPGDELRVRFSDGSAWTRVEKVEEEKNEQ